MSKIKQGLKSTIRNAGTAFAKKGDIWQEGRSLNIRYQAQQFDFIRKNSKNDIIMGLILVQVISCALPLGPCPSSGLI